ncbi:MAG: hypothetical protein ACI835_004772 [Planctomycetota bacterium]|jgi:hypothetical protein
MGIPGNTYSFGNGRMCLQLANTQRFAVITAGAEGFADVAPNVVSYSHQHFPTWARISAGQTWHFQGWYRDPASTCVATHSQTNAVSVTFGP